MSSMISVEEALKRVLASAETPLSEEKVALQAGYGRVLAHDLKALRTQPPFPNSAMDGYAIRSADATSAATTLTMVGESAAGRAFEGAVRARRCAFLRARPCLTAPTPSSFRRT
jgi:molybdopterin molybdotransferase